MAGEPERPDDVRREALARQLGQQSDAEHHLHYIEVQILELKARLDKLGQSVAEAIESLKQEGKAQAPRGRGSTDSTSRGATSKTGRQT